jgi:hypothetical protein
MFISSVNYREEQNTYFVLSVIKEKLESLKPKVQF